MMNFHMAVVTNCQGFAALRNHHLFPGLFPFQVFDLVYMMNFQLHISRAAEFTFLCFQPGIRTEWSMLSKQPLMSPSTNHFAPINSCESCDRAV